MPPPSERRFPVRGVVFVALAFALIGLAVGFRARDTHSALFSLGQLIPTLSDLRQVIPISCIGLIIVMAAVLGSYCGYLRVVFRLRKASKTLNQTMRKIFSNVALMVLAACLFGVIGIFMSLC